MKTLSAVCLLIMCMASAGYADESSQGVDIPAGMETRKVGDVNVVVPKGGVLRRDANGRVFIETGDEYAARKFVDVNEKFKELEEEIHTLRTDIDHLKQIAERNNKAMAADEKPQIPQQEK